MTNPLNKRIPRELKSDFGKYTALFLFLSLTIFLTSGFLVADNSMKSAYDESFEKYNIEDGHFILKHRISDALKAKVEKKGIKLHETFYKQPITSKNHKLRIFILRKKINVQDLLEGKLPEKSDEIAVDRLFARNNSMKTGDKIKVGGSTRRITGLVALTDYSALFENNTDSMLNATFFGVAVVTGKSFEKIDEPLNYQYSWLNDKKNMTDGERRKQGEGIIKVLVKDSLSNVKEVVPRIDNQAINFTGEDLGGDKAMFLLMLYIIIVILAFIFGVTTRSTLEAEAGSIGTLRASGFSSMEMVTHYTVLPILVTLAAAIVGNIFGYWKGKELIAGMYYNSYSLTTYRTLWNSEAFLLTTVVPCIIIAIVIFAVMWWTFRLSPMNFLRRDFKKRKPKHAVKLGEMPFLMRFRVRIVLQNKTTYFLMFLGVSLACILLLFGLMLKPLLDHYSDAIKKTQIAKYQYVLKAPVPVRQKGIERYAMGELEINERDDMSVYGIRYHSEYLPDLKLPEKKNEVIATTGYMEKYNVKVGDTVRLKKKYSKKVYRFKIAGSYNYTGAFSIFMTKPNFEKNFNKKGGYFNGYFSDTKIKKLKKKYVATTITEDDLRKISNQIEKSIGGFFKIQTVFSIMLYMLMIYLLAKLIVEKNADSISMVKILGYSNGEVGRLYNRATAFVVTVSLIVCSFASVPVVGVLYKFMAKEKMKGWLEYYVPDWMVPLIIAIGVLSYFVIQKILTIKIRRIPMSQALKNME